MTEAEHERYFECENGHLFKIVGDNALQCPGVV